MTIKEKMKELQKLTNDFYRIQIYDLEKLRLDNLTLKRKVERFEQETEDLKNQIIELKEELHLARDRG